MEVSNTGGILVLLDTSSATTQDQAWYHLIILVKNLRKTKSVTNGKYIDHEKSAKDGYFSMWGENLHVKNFVGNNLHFKQDVSEIMKLYLENSSDLMMAYSLWAYIQADLFIIKTTLQLLQRLIDDMNTNPLQKN